MIGMIPGVSGDGGVPSFALWQESCRHQGKREKEAFFHIIYQLYEKIYTLRGKNISRWNWGDDQLKLFFQVVLLKK